MVKAMAGCPAKMRFRMPAEWEPHEQCWMGWPVRTHPSLPPSPPIVSPGVAFFVFIQLFRSSREIPIEFV
ncbi:unnamed protein product [Triticum turgidum subsp. durum]|uniref:Uncharacterized protein n=1 Tax=Triticum turgidum subsp. durum TaxID=4567 RepID=A0A9R1PTY5_TRITD|nr:unnamed protein product [Triticum turgidum subsp. durum]